MMEEDGEREVVLTVVTDLAQYISPLLYSSLYSDVTVLCQDRNYFCHKVLVVTRHKVF